MAEIRTAYFKTLPHAENLLETDIVPIEQDGITKKAEFGNIRDLIQGDIATSILQSAHETVNNAIEGIGNTLKVIQQRVDTERDERIEADLYLQTQIYSIITGGITSLSFTPILQASGKRELVYRKTKIIDVEALIGNTLINGKDYYVHKHTIDNQFLVSLVKEPPSGYELIGGFHTLCANAGIGMTYEMGDQTLQHPLNGFLAGDILPQSVWCLNHRPFSEPEGTVYIPSLDFWVDIYLQSGSGANTKSEYQGAITRSRQYVDFVEDQFCVKKELLDDGEFAAAMLGSNEQTAVAGANEAGATTNGAGGRVDTAGRRMISIYGVEEGCGSLWQWLRTTGGGGRDGYASPVISNSANYGPFEQAGGKGSFYGVCVAFLAGGDWSRVAACGSRARSADTSRSNTSARLGGRGRSRAIHLAY